MDASDPHLRLLTEIRDAVREHLAEYKRVAAESLEIQRQTATRQAQAVASQIQLGRIYKVTLVVLALFMAGLMYFINWLVSHAASSPPPG